MSDRFRLCRVGHTFEYHAGLVLVASADLRCYHGVWTLRKCHVVPVYRGCGLQRRLIRARVRYAEKNGARRVTVWVNPRNSYSLNNLVDEGFRFMRRAPREFDGVAHVGLAISL